MNIDCIIEIFSKGDKKHISTNKINKSLCGSNKNKKDIIRIHDYEKPEQFDNICQSCLYRYRMCYNMNVIKKSPTVQCNCYRETKDSTKKCGKIISAYKARELKHPNSPNESDPVCPDCYNVIKSTNKNSVTSSYNDATPWLERNKSNA